MYSVSCPTLCNPMDCSPPGSSVHGFSRQEYSSGLPCPPPGDHPDPGIEPMSPVFPVLDSWPLAPPGKPPFGSAAPNPKTARFHNCARSAQQPFSSGSLTGPDQKHWLWSKFPSSHPKKVADGVSGLCRLHAEGRLRSAGDHWADPWEGGPLRSQGTAAEFSCITAGGQVLIGKQGWKGCVSSL